MHQSLLTPLQNYLIILHLYEEIEGSGSGAGSSSGAGSGSLPLTGGPDRIHTERPKTCGSGSPTLIIKVVLFIPRGLYYL
jgi:hypothetical protein